MKFSLEQIIIAAGLLLTVGVCLGIALERAFRLIDHALCSVKYAVTQKPKEKEDAETVSS